MKRHYLIPLLPLLLLAACKKRTDDSGSGETCQLSSVRMRGSEIAILRSPEGYSYPATYQNFRFFNKGRIGERVRHSDSFRLDDQGRIAYLDLPFENKRQTRSYDYNDQGQVSRTHTNTGTGVTYLADLSWENGDVVNIRYWIPSYGPPNDGFRYAYYTDKPAPDEYSAMLFNGQVGAIVNQHLLKWSIYYNDTVFYSYKFDEQGRIAERYEDRDASGWGGYKRAVDTAYYSYTCF